MARETYSLAEGIGRAVARVLNLPLRFWKYVFVYQVVMLTTVICYTYMLSEPQAPLASSHLDKRAWGGYDKRPQTEKCYRQERTAMLLSLFLGVLGVDQFYAHHWALAVFKLLTGGGFGTWALVDMILWIVGGVYGTPGCPGGSGGWQY